MKLGRHSNKEATTVSKNCSKENICASTKPTFAAAFIIFCGSTLNCFIFTVLSTTLAAINAAVQEQREAYFNGSSYIRLFQPMVLWRHSALSFRTCRGKFIHITFSFKENYNFFYRENL